MATINGTNDDDLLSALALGDVVNGLAGDDELRTLFDFTEISGCDGNDTITATASFSIFDGGPGDDTIVVSRGHDNAVQGGAGDDLIQIGPGDLNNISGGDGNDRMEGSRVSESGFHGGAGNDSIAIEGGILLFVNGEDGNDVLSTTGSQVELFGGDGNDVLEAIYTALSEFGNRLDGGNGDDLLQARGQATLTGGAGSDTFTLIDTGPDTFVTDFDRSENGGNPALRAEDVLDLHHVFDALPGSDKPLVALVGQGYLLVHADQNVGSAVAPDTVVQIDIDGRTGPSAPVTVVTLLDTTLTTYGPDMNNWSV